MQTPCHRTIREMLRLLIPSLQALKLQASDRCLHASRSTPGLFTLVTTLAVRGPNIVSVRRLTEMCAEQADFAVCSGVFDEQAYNIRLKRTASKQASPAGTGRFGDRNPLIHIAPSRLTFQSVLAFFSPEKPSRRARESTASFRAVCTAAGSARPCTAAHASAQSAPLGDCFR